MNALQQWDDGYSRWGLGAARGLTELLFPPRCYVCLRLGRFDLCADCRSRFLHLPLPRCTICDCTSVTKSNQRCNTCLMQGSRYFETARGVFMFHGAMREAIHAFKYRKQWRLAQPLGQLISDWIIESRLDTVGSIVVPVPLHRNRERNRGFNQSELLARVVCSRLNLPIQTDILTRCRNTQPQVERGRTERLSAMVGAFQVSAEVKGLDVVLIDDMLTTGATCDEAARVLVNAGAKRVRVITLARAGTETSAPPINLFIDHDAA